MAPPSILQTLQYLKDMSFENFILQSSSSPGAMALDVNVNVSVQPVGKPDEGQDTISGEYETALLLRVSGRQGDANTPPKPEDKPLFVLEVTLAGRYRFAGVPKTEVEPFLSIEAPRLLFPFARQIVADAITHGGLPPLLLAPIDFLQLYQQRTIN